MSPTITVKPQPPADVSVIDSLTNIGVSVTHAGVIETLLRVGPSSAADIEKRMKWPRATTYRILKEMVNLGQVALKPGRPTLYAAPAFDEVIAQHRLEATDRLARLEDAMATLATLTECKALGGEVDESGELRFIQGRAESYAALGTVISGAKTHFNGVFLHEIGASWCAASGVLDLHNVMSSVPKRVIYSDTEANRATVQGMPPIETTEFRFIDQQGETRFAVADGARLFTITHPSAARRFKEPAEVGMTTTARGLVGAHQALFDALWAQASP